MNNILTIQGKEVISILNSWMAWKKITGKSSFASVDLHSTEFEECPTCHGQGYVIDKTYGKIICICEMKEKEKRLLKTRDAYESSYLPKSLKDLVPWGTHEEATSLKYALKEINKWIEEPSRWLTISGNNGCGKSHILNSINTLFTPWSIYLSFPDLEHLYFQSIKDEDGLQLLVDALSVHPILIMDDIGADYGSKFAKSITQRIIDARYRLYTEFPTVIATNFGPVALTEYDRRIGDRAFDNTQNLIISLQYKQSYRKNGLAKGK